MVSASGGDKLPSYIVTTAGARVVDDMTFDEIVRRMSLVLSPSPGPMSATARAVTDCIMWIVREGYLLLLVRRTRSAAVDFQGRGE